MTRAMVGVLIAALTLSAILLWRMASGSIRPATPRPFPSPPVDSVPCFSEVATRSGVRFTHINGDTAGKDNFMEFTPGGCALFDYDNDGYLDILLIQSGSSAAPATDKSPRPHCALYHNRGDGTFADDTRNSGLDRDSGYLIGVAVGDYDNDGFEDLFLTGFRTNYLLRNTGRTSRRFVDVTRQMRLRQLHSTGFATSAAFGDYDRDGRLDLYICYYSDWTWGKDGGGYSTTLHNPDTHKLFHNDGDHFTDVSESAGISKFKGRGLAVGFFDYDDDGWPDIFVANDQTPNMLWKNNHNGTFTNTAVESGSAYSADGQLMAGMCVATADYDHSGRQSLFVTNRVASPNTLFQNIGDGLFHNATTEAGLAAFNAFSFGAEFLDYDSDGWADLMVVNGMINDRNLREVSHQSPSQGKLLYHNERDGRFREVTAPAALGALGEKTVSRGLAISDFDNDGRQDALVSNQNTPAQLFHNEDKSGNHWVAFKTVGTKSNRDGLHAKFTIQTGTMKQMAIVRAGSSYISASDRRVYFGLGAATKIDRVEILWPSGIRETLQDIAPDAIYTVTEGRGITGRQPSQAVHTR